MGEKLPKGTEADKIAYGEIRQHAVKSLKDHAAPDGLGDAKASMHAVSKKNPQVARVDGQSKAKKPADQAAWKNIVESKGTDKSKGANFFCIDTQGCWFVSDCYYWEGSSKKKKKRDKPLKPVATLKVGKGTIYFYKDEYQGWCTKEDYRGDTKGKK